MMVVLIGDSRSRSRWADVELTVDGQSDSTGLVLPDGDGLVFRR